MPTDDDTPVPVLAPGEGQTRTGRLWTYVRDDRPAGDATPPAVWFAWSSNRRGEHPQRHLAHFRGVLQADAFAGFAPLYTNGTIQEAACWAHVRRRFYDLDKAQASPLAAEALKRIGVLYAVEASVRGKPPEVRLAERQARAGPALVGLHAWFEATLRQLSQKSALAEAIRYALARWEALVRYSTDGRIEIDATTTLPNGRCARLPWGGRTIVLPAIRDEGLSNQALHPRCHHALCWRQSRSARLQQRHHRRHPARGAEPSILEDLGNAWLHDHLSHSVALLLDAPWALGIDTLIQPLHSQQDGTGSM